MAETAGTTVAPRTYLVARFVDAYPGLFWAPHWGTPDGVIPYTLFYELVGAIANVQAAAQLAQYYAALLANAQVWGGKDAAPTISAAVRTLTALAYPSARKPAPEPSKIVVVPR